MATLAKRILAAPRVNPLSRALAWLFGIADFALGPLQARLGYRRMAYFFLLPNMAIFGIFILFPMLLNFYYGFTGGESILPQNRQFVGAANLEKLFACQNYLDPNSCSEDLFWRGVANTGVFVVTEVGLIIVFALVTALALNRKIAGRGFFRSVFFYPVLLSPVVVALIWKWLLQQDGILNAAIVSLGGARQPFLIDANWARFWVIIVAVWAQMGFFTLILLAGLQSIPADLYEAASIDGASSWSSFRFVTFPMLLPTLFVVLVLSLIRAVQIFDHVFVLTAGGPGSATLYIVQYIYRTAFSLRNYGLAAAASLVLALALLALTVVQLRIGRRADAT